MIETKPALSQCQSRHSKLPGSAGSITSMDHSCPLTALSLSGSRDGPKPLLHRASNLQMTEKVEQRQKAMEKSMQEQRQQLQADQDDLANWKADAQRQLDIQQVCLDACVLCVCNSPGRKDHLWLPTIHGSLSTGHPPKTDMCCLWAAHTPGMCQ